uniref:Uncharacterized protein n=1 Tax=Arcella intermedia TaxID=1963864 RepID=A0A6B2LTQ4_9EUKA
MNCLKNKQPFIIQNFDEINFGGQSISCEEVKLIASALQYNTTLRELYLSNNKIGIEGAKSISNAIRINSSLRRLDFESNPSYILVIVIRFR